MKNKKGLLDLGLFELKRIYLEYLEIESFYCKKGLLLLQEARIESENEDPDYRKITNILLKLRDIEKVENELHGKLEIVKLLIEEKEKGKPQWLRFLLSLVA